MLPPTQDLTATTDAPSGRLKIGFRVGGFPKLSETFVMSQIEGLIAEGHDVRVLADFEPEEDAIGCAVPGITSIDFVGPARGKLARLYQRLPKRLHWAMMARAERRLCADVDVVVCNFGWFGAQVSRNIQGLPNAAKVLTIFHGDDMSRSLKGPADTFYDALLRSDGVHLPISRLWQGELLKLGARPEQTLVYRMGVDVDRFDFQERPDRPEQPFRLISVCRFVEKKGMAYALRAIAALGEQVPGRSVHFDLIGDGPLGEELKALTRELGLDEVVTFHGYLPHAEIAEALAKADAFILPSVVAEDGDMEGVPVSLMEAMASGLPVVSTRHSGIPELIEHGVSGLLADERDVEGLSAQLKQLIEDPAGRAERAKAARLKVETEFNLSKLAKQLSAICHASIAGPRQLEKLTSEAVG